MLCLGLLAPVAASGGDNVDLYVCFGKTTRLWKPNERGVVRGTAKADVIVVRRRDVVVYGRGGNDRICTYRRARIWAGAGHDLISSGRGRDHVEGGPGNDYLNGGVGPDMLTGGRGSDTLVGGDGNDALRGGNVADSLFGGNGSDDLAGGVGDDLLVGGVAGDRLDGGDGSDTVSFAFEAVAVEVDLTSPGVALATGDSLRGIENVRGSVFADTIVGTPDRNEIWGDDGDDVISSGGGPDMVDGGSGADVLDAGDDLDVAAFVEAATGVTADLVTGSSSEGDSLAGFENLRGSAHDDELYGDDRDNHLAGVRGTDSAFGLAGDDSIEDAASGDAGDGNDACINAATVANCEGHLHGDPAAYSLVDAGLHGATRTISTFRAIAGTASAGAFGPVPERVQVGLRRVGVDGCYWWDASLSKMEPWHCDRPIWNQARLRRDGTWDKQVRTPLQVLDPGRYQVRSRIKQPGYTERFSGLPYNVVEFRLQ